MTPQEAETEIYRLMAKGKPIPVDEYNQLMAIATGRKVVIEADVPQHTCTVDDLETEDAPITCAACKLEK